MEKREVAAARRETLSNRTSGQWTDEGSLALSPHFSAYAASDQVLLLSEERSFRLRGKPYVELIRQMDGKRDRAALLDALAGRVPAEQVHMMLDTMLAKGYARPVLDAPIARQAFWIECEREPREIEDALQRTTVGVITLGRRAGADADAVTNLTSLLEGSGVRVTAAADAEYVVALVDDYLQPGLDALNRQMRESGKCWLPVKPGGRKIWLGPLFHPDREPCWACLASPLLDNRPGDGLVANHDAAVRPARGMTPASITLALGFAAGEAARVAGGERHLDHDVLTFDVMTHAVERHRLRPHVNCPACSEAARGTTDAQTLPSHAPIVISEEDKVVAVDGGWRRLTSEQVVERLSPLISPITGIVSGVEDKSGKLGLPVTAARHPVPSAGGPRRNRLLGRPSGAAGKGESLAQAKAGALAEAVERYSCGWYDNIPVLHALDGDLENAISPTALLHFSERQFANREAWNKAHGDFNEVPEPFDATRSINWSPAWSLTHNAQRWLPTRYCYFNYTAEAGTDDENVFCVADSNGCAAGASLDEAVLQGLLELIERDACGLIWYNRIQRPAVDLESFGLPFADKCVDAMRRVGRSLHVLDLTTDVGIPVMMAVSDLEDGRCIALGLGAHLDPHIALSRCLAELNQMVALDDQLLEVGEEADPDTHDWVRNATLETEGYLVPADMEPVRFEDFERPARQSVGAAVTRCVRNLEELGIEVIAMDMSRPGIDFACARVVAPELRHFWARYAPGRLYDAPVKLGWLNAPLTEDMMNPRACFI